MMRLFGTVGTVCGVAFAGFLGWAVTLGGFSLEDPELEYERSWVQGFKYDQPELARMIGQQCKAELTRSPWTRDGAFELFHCIRTKAEAQGYEYV